MPDYHEEIDLDARLVPCVITAPSLRNCVRFFGQLGLDSNQKKEIRKRDQVPSVLPDSIDTRRLFPCRSVERRGQGPSPSADAALGATCSQHFKRSVRTRRPVPSDRTEVISRSRADKSRWPGSQVRGKRRFCREGGCVRGLCRHHFQKFIRDKGLARKNGDGKWLRHF
jgi:hypothetical protein